MGHIQATGFYMIHSLLTSIKYGQLFNWFALYDARNIANTGWRVPIGTDWSELAVAVGGTDLGYGDYDNAGGPLKETGTVYWNSPNSGATDAYGMHLRGGGRRNANGTFEGFGTTGLYGLLEDPHAYLTDARSADDHLRVRYQFGDDRRGAVSVRLIKDDSIDPGTYTGNDGKVYPTVKIGNQVWTARNLAETKYRNGDSIPEVSDNVAWAALTTGAMCAYNNNWDNV